MLKYNIHTFYVLYGAAKTAPDMETYIAEWSSSSALYPDGEYTEADMLEAAELLTKIYEVAHMDCAELRRKTTGTSQWEFAERVCTSSRTVERWESPANRTPIPDGIKVLLAELYGLLPPIPRARNSAW